MNKFRTVLNNTNINLYFLSDFRQNLMLCLHSRKFLPVYIKYKIKFSSNVYKITVIL